MIVYGLSTCDSTKKALKALSAAGVEHRFRDVRAAPLSAEEIATLVAEFGDKIINKQSTTYRGFNDFLRESEPEAQLAAQPTVMKRPVIHQQNLWVIGWDEAAQTALGI